MPLPYLHNHSMRKCDNDVCQYVQVFQRRILLQLQQKHLVVVVRRLQNSRHVTDAACCRCYTSTWNRARVRSSTSAVQKASQGEGFSAKEVLPMSSLSNARTLASCCLDSLLQSCDER